MKLDLEKVYKRGNVVRITTYEDDESFRKLAHEAGFKWKGGDSFLVKGRWGHRSNDICYGLYDGTWSQSDFYLKEDEYKIFNFKDVLIGEIEESKPIEANNRFGIGICIGFVVGAIVSTVIIKNI